MNAEISKIRKARNFDEEIKGEPTKISMDRLNEIIRQLNNNIFEGNYEYQDIDEFIKRLINNVFLILNVFDEMGVYPDYFYDLVFNVQIEQEKIFLDHKDILNDYTQVQKIKDTIRFRAIKSIKSGLERKYYHFKAYKKKDINNAYIDMMEFLKTYNIPYMNNTKENYINGLNKIKDEQVIIKSYLDINDTIDEDIYDFSRLFFQYMYFFVSMGINPKELLDQYIDSVENINSKSK